MRILVDYRPALRQRTGVGEYVHEMVRAYTCTQRDEVTVFTSSWGDRPAPALATQLGAHVLDRRIPVRILNLLWHRAGWPPVEWLGSQADVVHSAHPLLIPSTRAARVITVHDLFFLDDREALSGEIRRDYPALARSHAQAADAVITSSAYGKRQVVERLDVDPARIHVVPAGAPRWGSLERTSGPSSGYALFMGTLEPRKNIGMLLDAWSSVASATPGARLVLAGRAGRESETWLARLQAAPLRTSVEHRGYVPDADRQRLYAGARVLVLPSREEGFGLTALEAMAAGVPVIASARGAIPEVAGDAAVLLEPDDTAGWTAAISRVLMDDEQASSLSRRGLERARSFSWERSASLLADAYRAALRNRQTGPRAQ